MPLDEFSSNKKPFDYFKKRFGREILKFCVLPTKACDDSVCSQERRYAQYKEKDEKEIYQPEDGFYQLLRQSSLFRERPEMLKQRFIRLPKPQDTLMLRLTLNELIETERSYNCLLYLKYMEPMTEASKSKFSLVKPVYITALFNYLPELLELSNKLLARFERYPYQVGRVFQNSKEEFSVYLRYAEHYRKNIGPIKKACENSLFIKIDRSISSKRDSQRLGMSDYLIAPIQRVTRYCLLIKELQKYTQPPHKELDNLSEIMKNLAIAMNK
ncbi:unnamed protein product [Rhizopus stolonifer]